MELDFLEGLLEENQEKTESWLGYPIPEQNGPLRQFELEMRCASKGCGSSTFFKLQGVPRCMMHCLRKMNEMLIEKGVDA